jgi:asparagine synthase (glutamine-hydrolysing)
MCGIVGHIGYEQDYNVDEILGSLSHRGPDNLNFFKTNNIFLGHSLLRIMDTNYNSIQPVKSDDEKIILIFNGAIYNFRDLKINHLQNKFFNTKTDTEVLLHLYIKYGHKFTKFIKGMFTIVIYDMNINKVFIIRDEKGIKPLFYSFNNNNFYFSSEISTLLNFKDVQRNATFSEESLDYFLRFRILYNQDKTLISNIFQLKPNNIISFDMYSKKFNIQENSYSYSSTLKLNNLKFEELFQKIIKDYIISDHDKISTFLSGGLDSTLLTLALKNFNPDKELITFSVFQNNPNFENQNLKRLVKDENLINYSIHENDINFFDDVISTIKAINQPIYDASMVVHNRLCKLASEHKVKIIFTGNGGDEALHGYPGHLDSYLSNNIKNLNLIKYFNLLKIHKNSNRSYSNLIIKSIFQLLPLSFQNNFKNIKSNLLYDKYFDTKPVTQCFYKKKYSNDNFLNVIQNYFNEWGLNSYLDYEDKNSMSYGIECRLPYLSEELIKYSHMNTNINFEKGLKTLIRNHSFIPKYISNQKEKFGFAAPLKSFLISDLNKFKDYVFDSNNILNIKKDVFIKSLDNLDDNLEFKFRTLSFIIWHDEFFKKKSF